MASSPRIWVTYQELFGYWVWSIRCGGVGLGSDEEHRTEFDAIREASSSFVAMFPDVSVPPPRVFRTSRENALADGSG